MLAKELKIRTILKQREFIKARIAQLYNETYDGSPSYPYVGHVYKENIIYFQKEGFDVSIVSSDAVRAKYSGLPIYIFKPSEEIHLSDEEMEEAMKYALPEKLNEEEEDTMAELADNFFRLFLTSNIVEEQNDED